MKENLFEEIVNNNECHSKFKLLKSFDQFYGQRKILEDWVINYYDKDGKFVKEFQKTFHSSFWELYLSQVLYSMKLPLIQNHSRPDFIINLENQILVEAVVANIKEKGRKESTRSMSDMLESIVPIHQDEKFDTIIDEAITRYSNSIMSKLKLYKKNYIECDWVEDCNPFIIALGSYDQISYGREFIYPLLALLYGEYYNPTVDEYERMKYIFKPGTKSKIPLGIFNNEEYKSISAIIFSCTLTIGKLTSLAISNGYLKNYNNSVINTYFCSDEPRFKCQLVSKDNPELLTDGLFVFHNPNATNKLSMDLFNYEAITQITYDFSKEKILSSFFDEVLYSRLNTPTFQNKDYIEALSNGLIMDYNFGI